MSPAQGYRDPESLLILQRVSLGCLSKLAKLDHPCFLVTLTSGVPNKRQELQHFLSCFTVHVTKNCDTERIFDKQHSQQAYIYLHPI